jgi:hypothetical protein
VTDQQRERAIAGAGEQMEAWVQEWERTGCFAARGCADFWLRRMRELVAERSEQMVRRLEIERGLV